MSEAIAWKERPAVSDATVRDVTAQGYGASADGGFSSGAAGGSSILLVLIPLLLLAYEGRGTMYETLNDVAYDIGPYMGPVERQGLTAVLGILDVAEMAGRIAAGQYHGGSFGTETVVEPSERMNGLMRAISSKIPRGGPSESVLGVLRVMTKAYDMRRNTYIGKNLSPIEVIRELVNDAGPLLPAQVSNQLAGGLGLMNGVSMLFQNPQLLQMISGMLQGGFGHATPAPEGGQRSEEGGQRSEEGAAEGGGLLDSLKDLLSGDQKDLLSNLVGAVGAQA